MYTREHTSNISANEFVAHSTAVNCVAFGTRTFSILASGGDDNKVNIWNINSNQTQNIWTLGSNKSAISCLCLDSDERNVVSGAVNGSIKVFDLKIGKLVRSLPGHQINTSAIQYHPFGEFIVSGSLDSTVKVWDVRNKACIQTYSGHDKEITCIRFSPDGRWVATAGKDGNILIWDLVAGRNLSTIKSPSGTFVSCMEFCPTEFLLAGATSGRTVRFWDLETLEIVNSTAADSNPIRAISYSPDGTALFSATKDSLKRWNVQSSAKLQNQYDISWDRVCEMHLTSHNDVLAGSCTSNFVSIWSIDLSSDSKPSARPIVPTADVSSLSAPSKVPKSVASLDAVDVVREINNKIASAGHNRNDKGIWESNESSRDLVNTLSESLRKRYADQAKSVSSEEAITGADNDSGEEGLAMKLEAASVAEIPVRSVKSDIAVSKQSSRCVIDSDARVRPIEIESARARNVSAPNKLPSDRAERASNLDDQRSAIHGESADGRLVKVGKTNGKPSNQNRISCSPSPERSLQASGILAECQELAANLLATSEKTHLVLTQRSTEIRYIGRLWENQEIDAVLSHFSAMKLNFQGDYSQVVLLSELLGVLDIKGLGLTLDQAVCLLQIVEELSHSVRTDSDVVMCSILRTLLPLLEAFSDLIKQTRSTLAVGGVDISREERMRKCNLCYSVLYHFRQRWEQFSHMYRHSSQVLLLMGKVEPLLALATS